jgi:Zn-dependent peptidase ImmA (M78 family)
MIPQDVPQVPPDVLDQLLRHDPSGWSAVSIVLQGDAIVIYNPKHSLGRRASDIMHELAHFILDHKPATLIVSQDGGMVMRSYDAKQEEEANCLAWGLLLPREALLDAKRMKLSVRQIAEHHGVSEPLVTFRMNTTGVNRQFARRMGKH